MTNVTICKNIRLYEYQVDKSFKAYFGHIFMLAPRHFPASFGGFKTFWQSRTAQFEVGKFRLCDIFQNIRNQNY